MTIYTANSIRKLYKFYKYFRRNPLTTMKNSLKRISLLPLLQLLEGSYELQSQSNLMLKLFHEEEYFVIIILDACRADLFEQVYNRYINGRFMKVRSPASHTWEWVKKIFTTSLLKHKPILVYASNPVINSKGITVGGFKAIKYIPREYIIDVWEVGWNSKLQTVPPWKVNEIVKRRGLYKRTIIWYLQPHFPWINYSSLFNTLAEISRRRKVRVETILTKLCKKGVLSRKDILRGYIFNLHLVLKYVKELIDYIRGQGFSGKIVITSDHGEMFGEYGYYWHPGGVAFPELVVVPWLEA